ncbi:tetraacyldisaccharide 4'-kinase, partial [Litorivivens sp.]|uniref:tetraacyldisaccharide 4'-kinase n=1 Tax=Litorivivens sp. TaxID=2020868 RepID=UPI003567FBA1
MNLAARIERAWYRKRAVGLLLLWPLELLYRLLSALRKRWLIKKSIPQLTPVIVVGNISVGGTGKTPLVIAVVRWLQSQGYKPGVISRGYGGEAPEYPCAITDTSSAREVGDEPLLIARTAQCPVVVGPDRVAALARIESDFGCDIVVSDDGLQHYALQRDVEIIVVDGMRGMGNGHCLPVGPLREPPSRLATADLLVVNGETTEQWGRSGHVMRLEPGKLVNLVTGEKRGADDFPVHVHAVAGIGNPKRFFTTLVELGMRPVQHRFSDHHAFTAQDFKFKEPLPVVMTEKDAVKCQGFAQSNLWYVPVDAEFSASENPLLKERIVQLVKSTS